MSTARALYDFAVARPVAGGTQVTTALFANDAGLLFSASFLSRTRDVHHDTSTRAATLVTLVANLRRLYAPCQRHRRRHNPSTPPLKVEVLAVHLRTPQPRGLRVAALAHHKHRHNLRADNGPIRPQPRRRGRDTRPAHPACRTQL